MPAADLLDQADNVAVLTAAGITIVMSPTSTVRLAVDPAAVVGFLVRSSLTRTEPSKLGRTVAESLWGQVSVAAAGVATWT